MQVSFDNPCFCIYVKTYFEVCIRSCARQGRCVVKTQSLLEDRCRLTDRRREPQGSSVTSEDSGLGEEGLEPVWVNMMASWRS